MCAKVQTSKVIGKGSMSWFSSIPASILGSISSIADMASIKPKLGQSLNAMVTRCVVFFNIFVQTIYIANYLYLNKLFIQIYLNKLYM